MTQKYTTNIQRNIPQIHIKYETDTSVSTRVIYGKTVIQLSNYKIRQPPNFYKEL